MLFPPWLGFLGPFCARSPAGRPRGRRRTSRRRPIEPLEGRCLPASGASASLVADVVPGTGSSYPSAFTKVNDSIFFAAGSQPGRGEIWKTDGTASGTAPVKAMDFRPGNLTPMGGILFFTE